MMTEAQEKDFWNAIEVIDKEGALDSVIIIGSWAVYLYSEATSIGAIDTEKTRDVDILYAPVKKPGQIKKTQIPLISKMKEAGFEFVTDFIDGTSKFVTDNLELEVLSTTRPSEKTGRYDIDEFGIKAEGLRVLNILPEYTETVSVKGYNIRIPAPPAFVLQKLLSNPERTPAYKKEKDISVARDILERINDDPCYLIQMKKIYNSLSAKQKKTIDEVSSKYDLILPAEIVEGTNDES